MAIRQYIGARYVLKIYENSLNPQSADWEAGVVYEPLVMVNYQNSSYISRKTVPANIGNPVANPAYWALSGLYNGQIIQLQNDISAINSGIGNNPLTTVAQTLTGAINENAAGINHIGTELNNNLNDKFVLFDQHTHSFAVTGTNWAEALEALGSHLLAFIQGVANDAFIEICDLRLSGIGVSFAIPQHKFYDNTATAVTFPFFGMSASQSSAYIYTGTVWSGTVANNKLVRTWLRDNQYPITEIVDFTSLVPGPSFNFDMRIWKKIAIS